MLDLKTLNCKRDYLGNLVSTKNEIIYNRKSPRNAIKLIDRLNQSDLLFVSISSNKKHYNNIAIYYRSEKNYITIYGNKNLLFHANLLDILDVVSSKYFKYMKICDITKFYEFNKDTSNDKH